jgi:tRNA pseudouridine38-40 synthase
VVARNYRALVAYDGTDYGGFQIQADRPTIQGELERALQRLTQEFVRVHGAGRTDAGVHARGQVISFRTSWRHGPQELQRAMNAVLPPAIAVRALAPAPEDFHARFSACGRAYLYQIYTGPVRSPLLARFAHHVARPLDLAAMNAAAEILVGEHDLAAFGQPPEGENTVRVVRRAIWQARAVERWHPAWPASLVQFEIEANGFLRGMVRRIVGTLLALGQGWLSEAEWREIVASCDIRRAAAPAPACGLCLWRVDYGAEDRWPEEDLAEGRTWGWPPGQPVALES